MGRPQTRTTVRPLPDQPLICSSNVVCLVSYSAPMARLGRSMTTPPDNILSTIPVFLNLTVVKSSFIASPATAEGARFFLAEEREENENTSLVQWKLG